MSLCCCCRCGSIADYAAGVFAVALRQTWFVLELNFCFNNTGLSIISLVHNIRVTCD